MIPPPLRRVGPFEIGATLAVGHLCEVVLARSPGANAAWDFVLKRLLPHLGEDGAARQTLAAEAAVLRLVPSPPAPRLIAADLDGPSPWLAIARIEGEAVRPCDPRLTPARDPRQLRSLAAIARALADLHTLGASTSSPLGIVHGDLKPSHVICSDGPGVGVSTRGDWPQFHLIDFGNARAPGLGGLPEPTGTPAYLAPERRAGASPSQAADVYALGAMFWEFTFGRRHFQTPDRDIGVALAPIGQLADAIRAALSHDPRSRPSARAFASALAAVAPPADAEPAS
jgi:serine/threonine protein kinase